MEGGLDHTYSANIPQLSGEEKSFLEKDLTINELKEALSSFADNKSPGKDGFTKEFYQTFFFSTRTFLILIMRLSAKVHYLYPRNEKQ